jgi:hypothetical protein
MKFDAFSLDLSLYAFIETVDPQAHAKLAAALPSTTQILRGPLLHRRIRQRSG